MTTKFTGNPALALNLTSSLLHRTHAFKTSQSPLPSTRRFQSSLIHSICLWISMFFFLVFLCTTTVSHRQVDTQNQEMSIFKCKSVQPKPIRRNHHHRLLRHHLRCVYSPKRRSTSTAKTKSFSIIISSVSKSVHKCHHRLIKFFSRLAITRHHHGFLILERKETLFETDVGPRLKFEFETISARPPQVSDKKRTIVLDLDETLVHSVADSPPQMYDFMIEPIIDGVRMRFYVLKRPGVDEFLEAISKKYEVAVFTAGLEPYASLLLDILDPKGLIARRLYRDSCKQFVKGRYVKDLSKIWGDLGKVVIVDDNPKSYSLQPANAIRIKRFEDDIEDRELKKLMEFFQSYCDGFEDMRDAVKQYFGGATMSKPRRL